LKKRDSPVSSTGQAWQARNDRQSKGIIERFGFNRPFLVPEQEGIDMDEYKSMGGDCMSWARKRGHRARFGILLIVIGLLWFAQRLDGSLRKFSAH